MRVDKQGTNQLSRLPEHSAKGRTLPESETTKMTTIVITVANGDIGVQNARRWVVARMEKRRRSKMIASDMALAPEVLVAEEMKVLAGRKQIMLSQ